MSDGFVLGSNHCGFVFDIDENLNLFNLLRLFRHHSGDEINLDITFLDEKKQMDILTKMPHFLELFNEIISKSVIIASIKCSNIDSVVIKQLESKYNIEVQVCLDTNSVSFDVEACNGLTDIQDPHLVKNVRGAALLSLVQDLIELGVIRKTFSLFDENSPIFLHSANELLYNKDNAKMVWDVLVEWEGSLDDSTKINKMIFIARQAKDRINNLIRLSIESSLDDSNFHHLYSKLIVENLDIGDGIYDLRNNINLWFIDDQHANGWSRLLKKIISDPIMNIECIGSVAGVSDQISLATKVDKSTTPDLALVDLRLSDSDVGIARYNADDLSGFQVVEMLLSHWRGLPIMIASASNKLWNMEKAIQKGAVSYWRKSDEVVKEPCQNSILTAFDIYIQFTEKLSTVLKKIKYRNIFKIVEEIRSEISEFGCKYSPLQVVVENFFKDLDQKTSWMCWRGEDEENVIDSLYLSVHSIYNELEVFLWNKSDHTLILFPTHKIREQQKNADSLVIDDTLYQIDKKYKLTGKALNDYYKANKGIRNKLPNIHGSVGAKDINHAKIIDIESSLLIILCILKEIKKTNNHN
ncbi:response regulator [Vibrio fluvialis]|nr:response regulator [Vibrio fluvialis]MBY8115746.1 response regulator [Vibrio fluvialis]MBY8248515.1 response regulator [Vibrio fluvialis]MBY8282507.1 response regulator [Vibrio fluvialis]